MQYRRLMQATLGSMAVAMAFSVAAQTQASRANPPSPSPPDAAIPERGTDMPGRADAVDNTGLYIPVATTGTGNSGTDPAMVRGMRVSPAATPGPTPGTAGTQSGSTDLTPTDRVSTQDGTTRSN